MLHWSKLLGRDIPLTVMEDNQATITVAKNSWSPKLRHVLRSHKVDLGCLGEEFVDGSQVSMEYVESAKQAADISTKALSPQLWSAALRMLGIRTQGSNNHSHNHDKRNKHARRL